MAQHRSILPIIVLALGGGAIIWAATSRLPVPPVPPATAIGEPGICVTPMGLCNAPALPTNYPCSCPNPLRGMVRGHIERLGNAPAMLDTRDELLRDEDQWGRIDGP